MCGFPNNDFVIPKDKSAWVELAPCLTALLLSFAWTYGFTMYLAYRDKHREVRELKRQQRNKLWQQKLAALQQQRQQQAMDDQSSYTVSLLDETATTEGDLSLNGALDSESGSVISSTKKLKPKSTITAPSVRLGLRSRFSNLNKKEMDVMDEMLHLEDDSVPKHREEVRVDNSHFCPPDTCDVMALKLTVGHFSDALLGTAIVSEPIRRGQQPTAAAANCLYFGFEENVSHAIDGQQKASSAPSCERDFSGLSGAGCNHALHM